MSFLQGGAKICYLFVSVHLKLKLKQFSYFEKISNLPWRSDLPTILTETQQEINLNVHTRTRNIHKLHNYLCSAMIGLLKTSEYNCFLIIFF